MASNLSRLRFSFFHPRRGSRLSCYIDCSLIVEVDGSLLGAKHHVVVGCGHFNIARVGHVPLIDLVLNANSLETRVKVLQPSSWVDLLWKKDSKVM